MYGFIVSIFLVVFSAGGVPHWVAVAQRSQVAVQSQAECVAVRQNLVGLEEQNPREVKVWFAHGRDGQCNPLF